MSLRDGTQKMSKSAESDMTRINLTDDADLIAQKIKKAKTDAGSVPSSEAEFEGRPEAKNLITIYAALAGVSKDKVMAEYGGQQFSTFKNALSDLCVDKMSPITNRMRDLMADTGEIDRILADSADKAAAIAEPVMAQVNDIMGFWKRA
jgi:tryptophanyl-tRNA synthetase